MPIADGAYGYAYRFQDRARWRATNRFLLGIAADENPRQSRKMAIAASIMRLT